MYILVEIIHTEFQYISLIEMQKYNWNRKRIEIRKTWKKKRHFVPVGNTNRDKRVRQPRGRWQHLLSRLPDPGQNGTSFSPGLTFRLGIRDNRGFPTETNQYFCSSGTYLDRKGHNRWIVIRSPIIDRHPVVVAVNAVDLQRWLLLSQFVVHPCNYQPLWLSC